MEDSMAASLIHVLSCDDTARISSGAGEEEEGFEESGWTSYVEDFMFHDSNTRDENGAFSSSVDYESCHCNSLVSHDDAGHDVLEDDDLEDTATSANPAAIPKEKRIEYGEFEADEDKIEVGYVEKNSYCRTGLKNIGLCLVPLSMAVNYFS